MTKEALIKKYKILEKKAKKMGFDRVYYDEYGMFVAEHTPTRLNVRRDERYGSQTYVEIGWSSAGTPRPSNAQVKKFIVMLQNALKLKEMLK